MRHTLYYQSQDSDHIPYIKKTYEIICIISLLVLYLRITNK